MIQEQSNYPPYNFRYNLNNHESKLEIALAGFKKKEVKVYTLNLESYMSKAKKKNQEDVGEDVHKGLGTKFLPKCLDDLR